MVWNSELINLYNKIGKTAFIRDEMISSILGENVSKFKCPYVNDIHVLRSSNIKYDFSSSEMQRVLEVKNDIKKIQDYVLLDLLDFQEDMLETISQNRFTLFNVSRQIGTSTVMSLYTLYYALFNNQKTTMVVCPNQDSCQRFYELILSMYFPLPFFMKKGIKKNKTKSSISFDNGSKIHIKSTFDSCIGFNIDNLILSDFSFHKKQEKTFNYLFPTIRANAESRIIIFSIPNKSDDRFASLLNDASAFTRKSYPWTVIKERDEQWENDRIKEIGVENFIKLYECMIPDSKSYSRSLNLKKILN